MSPGKEPASLLAEAWHWPIDVTQYDRSPALSPAERETMTRLVARFRAGGKSWHPGARPALERLLLPPHAALNHIGAGNVIKHKYPERTTVICLLVRAMHREDCAFWAFPTPVWHELLGRDYDAYARRHGANANGRQQLVAVAYLLCGFNDLGALGRLAHYSLATKVFGRDLIDAAIADVLAGTNQLASWYA